MSTRKPASLAKSIALLKSSSSPFSPLTSLLEKRTKFGDQGQSYGLHPDIHFPSLICLRSLLRKSLIVLLLSDSTIVSVVTGKALKYSGSVYLSHMMKKVFFIGIVACSGRICCVNSRVYFDPPFFVVYCSFTCTSLSKLPKNGIAHICL